MPRALPRTVWILGLVSLLMDLSSEIIHALLPAFITVTLALPVAAMGALDGIAEAAASFAKLASGALSDKQRRRRPWILAGYGLAALAKPLFPLAQGALPVLGARLIDRFGKGLRGAPRDALIADVTPPARLGAAYGLRQSLDTVGAFLAPLAAIGLMLAFADDMRAVFWVAVVPAALAVLVIVLFLREGKRPHAPPQAAARWAGFADLPRAVKRLLLIALLVALARFSEGFLVLKGIEAGLSLALSPLMLVLFNLAFLALAYPAGALSDRIAPGGLLVAGMALLVAANLVLAAADELALSAIGTLLWGAHMALTQGVLTRMIAAAAPDERRATSFGAFHFVSGVGALASSIAAGLLWDRFGSAATFLASAGAALLAAAALLLLSRAPPAAAASARRHGRGE